MSQLLLYSVLYFRHRGTEAQSREPKKMARKSSVAFRKNAAILRKNDKSSALFQVAATTGFSPNLGHDTITASTFIRFITSYTSMRRRL